MKYQISRVHKILLEKKNYLIKKKKDYLIKNSNK